MRTHCQLTHLHLQCLQIQLLLCLALYGFNPSIYNLFALLQRKMLLPTCLYRICCNVNVTESLNRKSNTNDVDQTAQLFCRFIFVVCTDIKSISQYHHFMGEHTIKHVNLDFFSIPF